MMLADNAMTLITQRRTKYTQVKTGSRLAMVGFIDHCLQLPEISWVTKNENFCAMFGYLQIKLSVVTDG